MYEIFNTLILCCEEMHSTRVRETKYKIDGSDLSDLIGQCEIFSEYCESKTF